MEGSGDAYERLIDRLRESMPEIAAQISEEIARGRLVPTASLPRADLEDRARRMRETNAGRVSKDELASVPYSDDERLFLLVEAVRRLIVTAVNSREAILKLDTGATYSPIITFGSPEGGGDVEVELPSEAVRAANVLITYDEVLSAGLEQLRADRP